MTSETSSINQNLKDRTGESTPTGVDVGSAPSSNNTLAPDAPFLSHDLDPRPAAVLAGINASEFLSLSDARGPVVNEDESVSNLDERLDRKPDAVSRNFIEPAPFYGTKESVGMVGTMEATGSAGLLNAGGIGSESILISRAQAGDHEAFEQLFNQYQAQIYNYIYRLMGSAEDANDMTQDTFLKAYLALSKTSQDLRVGAWLYRIATNVCLDELRHRKLIKWQPWETFVAAFHPTQVAKDSPERDCINRENSEEVQLIFAQMHPKYRMCLILREYHDLSYDEIAEVLNTTRAAVKSLLFRAREEFRQVFAKVERQPGRAGQ
ncbi:MAG: RNA polymerase sigma factor [Chloroflexota bacterium]|jgi:RNA polymerase sigma-70 factor (ECF subfamily)